MPSYVYHKGSLGDIIYSLPAISCMERPCVFVLNGIKKEFWDNLYCLLKQQPYIDDIVNYYYLSMDERKRLWRELRCIDMRDPFIEIIEKQPCYNLPFLFLKMLNKNFDLNNKWLFNINPIRIKPIVISWTNRYHDHKIKNDYYILEKYKKYCIFLGHPIDHEKFYKKYKIDIIHYRTRDLLEMAQIIKGGDLFIGNQSVGFALAEGMKHPRILERYSFKDNCIPHGIDWYDNISEDIIEKYLNK